MRRRCPLYFSFSFPFAFHLLHHAATFPLASLVGLVFLPLSRNSSVLHLLSPCLASCVRSPHMRSVRRLPYVHSPRPGSARRRSGIRSPHSPSAAVVLCPPPGAESCTPRYMRTINLSLELGLPPATTQVENRQLPLVLRLLSLPRAV